MPDWFTEHAPGTTSAAAEPPRERSAAGKLWDLIMAPIPGVRAASDAAHAAAKDFGDWITDSESMNTSPIQARARLFGASLANTLADMIPSSAGGIAATVAGPKVAGMAFKAGRQALGAGFEALDNALGGTGARTLEDAVADWRALPTGAPKPPVRPQPELNAPGGYTGMGSAVSGGEPVSRLEQVFGIEPRRLQPPLPADEALEAAVPSVPRTVGQTTELAPGMAGDPLSRLEQQLGLDPERIVPGGRHWSGEPPRTQGNLALAGERGQPDLFEDAYDDVGAALNGSGDSAASLEALSRVADMKRRGEQFMVYDRAGQARPLNGVDAVDYTVRPGETFGVQTPTGFRLLDDAGGRVPRAPEAPAPIADVAPDLPPGPVHDLTPEPTSDPLDDVLRLLRGETPAAPASGAAAELAPPIDTAPGPNSVIHPIKALYEKLVPKWEQALARGEEIPFVGEPGRMETWPEFYNRVVGEPKMRFGAERKAMKPFDAAYDAAHPEAMAAADAGGEAGFIDPELLSARGVDTLMRGVPKLLESPRYFSMLSGPSTQAVNVVGNVGAMGIKALEQVLTGNPGRARDIVKEAFSPETVSALRSAWRNPIESRWGTTEGILGIPGRAMGAVDEASRSALTRAGLSDEEALLTTFRNDPKSATGQAILELVNNAPLIRFGTPFTRTAVNLVERGLERTPGVGLLPWVRDMTGAGGRELAARQILGTGAAAGGYALSKAEEADRANRQPTISGQRGLASRLSMAALASLSLPASLGMAAEQTIAAKRKQGKTPSFGDMASSGVEAFRRAAPTIGDTYDYNPANVLASFVPGALRDLSPVEPTSLDPNRPRDRRIPTMLGPAIARIPLLNELLLYRRPRPDSAPTLGSTVASWFDEHAPQ